MPVNPLGNGPDPEIRLREPPKAPEEGDECPECGGGTLEWIKPEECSCHVHPPCGWCTNAPLTCTTCGWSTDDDDQF